MPYRIYRKELYLYRKEHAINTLNVNYEYSKTKMEKIK